MERNGRKRLRRSPALLFVVIVTTLGLAGVAYAHWFTTLTSEGQLNTGNVWMGWSDVGTDDDGWFDNDPSGTDCDDPQVTPEDDGEAAPCAFELWDGHTPNGDDPGSSADPSAPFAEARYDKDVARCDAGHFDNDNSIMTWINNAYPSYHCTTYATAFNHGSVPVKAGALTIVFEKGFCEFDGYVYRGTDIPYNGPVWYDDEVGPFADQAGDETYGGDEALLDETCEFVGSPINFQLDGLGFFDAGLILEDVGELDGEISEGILCGTQIDPGDGIATSGWIHVNNHADQNAEYRWTITQQFVNWNEWDVEMCTFNGIPLF